MEKSCPNCGLSVPIEAARCKDCFHDFSAHAGKRGNPLVGFLALVFVCALLGAGTMAFVYYNNNSQSVVVDEETKSIVFTHMYAAGIKTDRVGWDKVMKVEHVIGGDTAMYAVEVLTTDGERLVVHQSPDESLDSYGAHIATLMGKPYEEVNKVPGFKE